MTAIDISMVGSRALEKKLHKMITRVQKKIVRQALRKEAKEAKGRIVANIRKLHLIQSGTMLAAYSAVKIKSTSKRNFVRLGPENPTRAELGIPADDKYYYPYAVEFGHDNVPPKPFIRPAIDDHRAKSIVDIGRDIGVRIEREGRK